MSSTRSSGVAWRSLSALGMLRSSSGATCLPASPGTWGDRLRVQVTVPDTITAGELADQYGVPAASFFNLRINEDRPNGLIEEIRTLTVVESRRRVDRVLEQES